TLLAHADLELELDEDAAEAPFAADLIDDLRRADQAQPQLLLVTLDLAGGAVLQARRPIPRNLPAAALGAKPCPRGGGEDAGGAVVADGGAVDDHVQAA